MPQDESATLGCGVQLIPEGAGEPGFRVVEKRRVSERIVKTRVAARGVTHWEIHGYEPDAMLILGSALSTVAGVVVTPVFYLKRLFTGWGEPKDEAEMRQRIHDRYLRSWLFLGYLWAPVDYEVLDRHRWSEETGQTFEFQMTDGAGVRAMDEQGRPVVILSVSDGLYRPLLTDALLESSTLYVTASCQDDSDVVTIDLLPWYRRRYALTPEEVAAFKTMAPPRRPYLLKTSPNLRGDFLALDEGGWRAFASKVPSKAVGSEMDKKPACSFVDDLPDLLNKSPRIPTDFATWLFVVGIEDYDQATPIAYSRRSAELFTRVAMKRLGVPAENVFLLTDDGKTEIRGLKGRTFPATAASIQDQLRFLMREVNRGDRIYLYYSGHGLPSLVDEDGAYLLARDQSPDFIHTAPEFRVDAFYEVLAGSRAGEIVIFMDSCFTGLADNTSVFGNGRAATRLVPIPPDFDKERMVVITAGTKRQFSTMYPEKGHRLFSYFLMKELLNEHDTVESLYQALFIQTRRVSRSRGGTQIQEPTIRGKMQINLPARVKIR